VLVTLITSVLLSISNKNGSDYFAPKTFMINNRYFQYFGDISYSLYLYHWPILLFIKYYFAIIIDPNHIEMNIYHHVLMIIVFSISFIFAFISYHLIEKYFLSNTIGYLKVYLFIVISYAVLLLLLIDVKYRSHNRQPTIHNVTIQLSTSEIIRINEAIGQKIGFPWLNQCEHYPATIVDRIGADCQTHYYLSCILNNDTTENNARFNVLVLGDSHAHRHFYAIRNSLRQLNNSNVSGVHLFSQSGCIPIIDNDRIVDADNGLNCPLFRKCIRRLVSEMRPDYLFFFTKYTQHIDRYLAKNIKEKVSRKHCLFTCCNYK
jgi:hypothetical protein